MKMHIKLTELLKKLPITVNFQREENGSFWAESPDLPGCFAQGENLISAMEEFKYSVFIYFEVPKKLADPKILRYTAPVPAELVDTSYQVEDSDPHLSRVPQQLVPSFV